MTEHVRKTLCFHGFWAWFMQIFLIVGGIVLCLWLIRKFLQGPRYCKQNRIDGKVVIITGCNTGIGKETALELARRGGRIYMACRDPVRCEAARLEIIERTGNQNVFNRTLNLSSLESVRDFASRFLAEEDRLDILINNAGVMASPRELTIDGYEQQFAVNHLAHFLLTNLLLPRLKQSSPSRIVILTSIAHLFGRINKDDLNLEKKYTRFGAYAQSKLANVLFMIKLKELLKDTGVTVNSVHPGIVNTDLYRYSGNYECFWRIVNFFIIFIRKTVRAGAQTSLRVALDPVLKKKSGGYYADSIRWPLLPKARNKEMADWLWMESEKMVGMRARSAKDFNNEEENGSIVINNL